MAMCYLCYGPAQLACYQGMSTGAGWWITGMNLGKILEDIESRRKLKLQDVSSYRAVNFNGYMYLRSSRKCVGLHLTYLFPL